MSFSQSVSDQQQQHQEVQHETNNDLQMLVSALFTLNKSWILKVDIDIAHCYRNLSAEATSTLLITTPELVLPPAYDEVFPLDLDIQQISEVGLLFSWFTRFLQKFLFSCFWHLSFNRMEIKSEVIFLESYTVKLHPNRVSESYYEFYFNWNNTTAKIDYYKEAWWNILLTTLRILSLRFFYKISRIKNLYPAEILKHTKTLVCWRSE